MPQKSGVEQEYTNAKYVNVEGELALGITYIGSIKTYSTALFRLQQGPNTLWTTVVQFC